MLAGMALDLESLRMSSHLARESAATLARVACLLVALTILGCAEPKLAALPHGSLVLALGDSITAGFGVQPEQAWPALLEQRTGWRVVNAGVNGDRSADGRKRLDELLERHKPAAVLIELGGNDMLRRIPEEETIANLAAILDRVQAAGARPILLGIPRPSVLGALMQRLAAAPFYAALAARHGAVFVEDAVPQALSDPALRLDSIHPNAKGHAALASEIEVQLRESGLLR